uniref:sigma factor-like helix-turn-helix DNA-binding protein n=1 Tax=uncultured Sphingomonas sp. TaxID=158754 RepID=UPI0035C95BAF
MTDNSKKMKARARRAFDRSIEPGRGDMQETADPELLVLLERAMDALPRRTREVFLANRVDDLSYADIARVTGLSRRQVQRQMARALYHLSCFMDGDERTPRQRWWDRLRRRWRR